jgi:hypothetical protein
VFAGLALPTAGARPRLKAPGGWTQAQVNTAITNGVAYLDTQQNADGSYGSGSVAETGIALAAYGVLANGNFSSLPSSYQTHVQNAITFLLNLQDTTSAPGPGSNFGDISNLGFPTYETGLALTGLSPFTTVNSGVPTAIADGRTFLTNEFQGPTYTGWDSSDTSSTAFFCGGWNYDPGQGRSDESNTGYAMTGLEVTGGIPASIVPDDINWQHHVQEITGNPFATRNDGGSDYEPGTIIGCNTPYGFCSNANDSGTNLFSYADLGVAMSDPHVAAAILFDQDVLNSYELMQANVGAANMHMIAHSGATEDGSCTPDTGGCDWYTSGDGGYHYSLFALTKGLGGYIPANLSDPTNWYAKVVDLQLTQQNTDGSWPPDPRDDFTTVFATGLAVSSLGLVAVAPTITLAPNTQTQAVGGSATVTATLLSGGTPVPGVSVSFSVTAGPNGGKTGSGNTNASGQASFTYTDTGGAGTDTVSSSFVDSGGTTHTSNSVSVVWQTSGTIEPPKVTIKEPQNEHRYRKNQVVHANYTCTDSVKGPGIASCVGTVPNGSPIDTSTPGVHTFTVTATSKDGQTTTRTIHYRVVS